MPIGPSKDAAAALRRSGVDAQLLLTARAGHNLHLESPDEFAQQVIGRIGTGE